MKPEKSGWPKKFAYLCIAFAAAGIASPFEGFVRFKVGPVHTLELILIGWLAALLAGGGNWNFRVYRKPLWPAMVFLGWGAAVFGMDLAARRSQLVDDRSVMRFLQHTLVFIYPLVWMTGR